MRSVPHAPRLASTLPRLALLALAAGLVGACVSGCASDDPVDPGILAGRAPMAIRGVTNAARMNDGVLAPPGAAWNSEQSAVFRDGAIAIWDLGEARPIRGVFVQGDNNDSYVVQASLDGQRYEPLFTAGPVGEPGLQGRASVPEQLETRARYLRVRAEGGDRSFSISELAIYERLPEEFPPELHEPLWPASPTRVSLVRALTAALALFAVLLIPALGRRARVSRVLSTALLGICAVIGLLAFYNLAQPQFWDAGEGRPTFLHHHDMRVYHPVAKYFRELRFDGVYAASLAALEDIEGPRALDRRANVEFRDLRTHELVRVADAREEIAAVKARFSPERWAEFVTDMRYFHHVMGGHYVGSMMDHGANATPVWLLGALGLFAWTPASDALFELGALVDLGLLLLAFAAIGRSFGLRTMFLSMVFFGANDFIMFGSNWAGATLRHDWMAYLALGICALRSRHFVTAGALLALAALIRAFPVLALVGVVAPLGWALIRRRRPDELEATLRVCAGAAVTVIALWLTTSLIFGFNSWPLWLGKVALLSSGTHINSISLPQLGSWAARAGLPLPAVIALCVAFGLLYIALCVRAGRGKPLETRAILGLMLLPIVFDPANYYSHVFFLLPLLVGERELAHHRDLALLWLPPLAICVASYFTVGLEMRPHFQYESLILLTGLSALLVLMIATEAWTAATKVTSAPSPAG